MELALGRAVARIAGDRVHLVSILVFVELALGLQLDAPDAGLPQGFNPCFRGTRSRTLRLSCTRYSPVAEFQSLFSWNSLSDLTNFGRYVRPLLFQSLFSWNSLSDICPNSRHLSSGCWMFQSLFSWNSLSDMPRTRSGSCA